MVEQGLHVRLNPDDYFVKEFKQKVRDQEQCLLLMLLGFRVRVSDEHHTHQEKSWEHNKKM